jgi:DNA-directed RNA polymerase specialized sigma subunit
MLVELFKSEERLKILYCSLYQKDFTVMHVSRETGVTKGLVSRYLKKLDELGKLQKRLKEMAETEVNPVVLTPQKLTN